MPDEKKPNIIQRTIRAVLGQGVEEESRRWVFDCECGEQWSVWDNGGVRYKAAGKPLKMSYCPGCGKKKLRKLLKLPK